MSAILRALAVPAMLVLLSACYTSNAPLLTPAEADYPFPARVEYSRTDTAGVVTQGTLRREGDHYVRTQPGLEEATTLLFQRLEGEYYLVQETNVATQTANYDAVRITPHTVYLLGMRCSEIFDAGAIQLGNLHGSDTDFGYNCEAWALETVRAALEARMTSVQPQESYVILGSFE